MCVLHIVVYIDAISVNSPFIYMNCQALYSITSIPVQIPSLVVQLLSLPLL